MQAEAQKVFDVSSESQATKKLYGLDDPKTADFGWQCLLARRLAEADVRFIQCTHSYKWDQHSDLFEKHNENAAEVDKPIAGLLTDLKARGLLKDTLVIWSGEFGRTPVSEGGTDAITILTATPCSWRAVALSPASHTARLMTSGTMRWRIGCPFTISTPRFCALLGLDHTKLTLSLFWPRFSADRNRGCRARRYFGLVGGISFCPHDLAVVGGSSSLGKQRSTENRIRVS